MKFLVVALVAANCFMLLWCQSMPNAPTPDTTLLDHTKKCMVQEKVEQQDIIDFASGKVKSENASTAFKCFVRCVVEARGYMKDGKLMEDNVVKAAENFTSVDQVRKIISNCNVKGSDVCETSFNIYVCIMNELK